MTRQHTLSIKVSRGVGARLPRETKICLLIVQQCSSTPSVPHFPAIYRFSIGLELTKRSDTHNNGRGSIIFAASLPSTLQRLTLAMKRFQKFQVHMPTAGWRHGRKRSHTVYAFQRTNTVQILSIKLEFLRTQLDDPTWTGQFEELRDIIKFSAFWSPLERHP